MALTRDSAVGQSGDLVVGQSDPLDAPAFFPGLRPIDGHPDVIDAEIEYMCLEDGGIT